MTSRTWAGPVVVLGIGWIALLGIGQQADLPLRGELQSVLPSYDGYTVQDVPIPEAEQAVAGMSDYLMRVFTQDSTRLFSVYVGYYRSQKQGRSIHSPKNCLPGGGWEPVSADTRALALGGESVTVNRYVIAKGSTQALVYYWYQGRGRVAWDEYAVKWNLLRDKARYRRSDEALVRLVIPLGGVGEASADSLAADVASRLVPSLNRVLPEGLASAP